MTFPTAEFAATLPWPALAIVVVLLGTYVASRIAGKHAVIDVAWGLLFVAAVATSFAVTSGDGSPDHGDGVRRWLLLAMVGIWGIRLAWHIGIRSRGKGEDPRYEALLKNKSPLAVIATVYGLQGALAWVISMPAQVGMLSTGGWWPLVWIGVAIWAVGVFFEAVGDWQLERYKADSDRGPVMDRGLWRYTRHPNYFGDACVWVGIFAVSASAWPGVVTIFAPAIMVYLLAFGSGKRVLERSMAKRPGYRDYMRRTSGFIPLPPRT